jgi:hypothetical protein
MPATLTTVPAVLVALVALGEATLPSGFTVYDGPPDVDNLPGEFLCVGWSRDEDEAGVDGGTADEGNGTASETYAVHCLISVATGDVETGAVARRRARVTELFTAFAAALRADATLAGVLTAGGSATLGTWAWVYGPSTDGTFAEIEFDVNVAAYYLGAT